MENAITGYAVTQEHYAHQGVVKEIVKLVAQTDALIIVLETDYTTMETAREHNATTLQKYVIMDA